MLVAGASTIPARAETAQGVTPLLKPPIPTFVDEVGETGLSMNTLSVQSAPYDVNGDGLTDVLLNRNVANGVELYMNQGNGHFVEAAAGTWGAGIDRRYCEWGDFNGDGKADLFCSVGANHGTSTSKADELWLQGQGLQFTNVAVAWGVTDPYGRGRRVVILDANGDGRPDIFLQNKSPRTDGIPSPDRLFINVDGTHFRDASEYGLDLEQGGDAFVKTGDINHDGRPDLALCSDTHFYLYENVLGTSFSDVTVALGLPQTRCTKVLLEDVNGDGRADVIELTGKKVFVTLQQSDGTFGQPRFTRSLTTARDIAAADFNRDGIPDFYIAQGPSSPPGPVGYDVADTVLLGRGDGTFVTVAVSPAPAGASQSVSTFDAFGDGRFEALVMSGTYGPYGFRYPGPVQLLTPTSTPPVAGT
jgi:hypothetical protein